MNILPDLFCRKLSPGRRWTDMILFMVAGLILPSHSALDAKPFEMLSNSVVRDQATGLVWQRCANGQTPSSGVCQGSPTTVSWSTAIGYCEGLNLEGYSWRLPNAQELHSIVETDRPADAIDPIVFFGNGSFGYWTSTAVPSDPVGTAFVVDFAYGTHGYGSKTTNQAAVRCVSGP